MGEYHLFAARTDTHADGRYATSDTDNTTQRRRRARGGVRAASALAHIATEVTAPARVGRSPVHTKDEKQQVRARCTGAPAHGTRATGSSRVS